MYTTLSILRPIGMSLDDIVKYNERTSGVRSTPQELKKYILDKFSKNADGQLNLEGFFKIVSIISIIF